MKVFVISLKRAEERRQFMIKQLDELKLDYELVDAIDATEFTEDYLQQICRPEALGKFRWWMTNGVIACSLSHLKVYRMMEERNIEYALVLEDDSILPGNIKQIIGDIPAGMNKNEVVNLYYVSKKPCMLSTKGERRFGKYRLLYPMNPDQPLCASSYIIDLEAAINLQKVNFPIAVASDTFAYFLEKKAISSYACLYPAPCGIANFRTTLGYTKENSIKGTLYRIIENNKIPLFYQLKYYYRKIKRERMQKKIDLTDEISPLYKQLNGKFI